MNVWQNAVFTNKGLALQAKLIAGTTLNITRAVSGSGYVTPGALGQQTAVSSPKQTLSFMNVIYPEEGKVCLPCRLTNDGLSAGYTAMQVGIYATDPDEGEILYFIVQADSGSGTIVPSAVEMPGFSAEWDFYFQYGQADDVSVTVDPSNAVTYTQAQAMIRTHDESENAHEGILAPVMVWESATSLSTYKRVYIDPQGSDNNAGGQTAPMATIIGAIRKYAETCKWLDIYMNDGTYTQEIGIIAFDACDISIRSTNANKENVTINITQPIDVMMGSFRMYNLTINMTAENTRAISVDNGRLYMTQVRVSVPETSISSCVSVYNAATAWLYYCIINGGTATNAGACVYGNQALLIKAINCTSERTVALGFYAFNASNIEYTATMTATVMKKEQALGKCYLTTARPIVSAFVNGAIEAD